MVIGLHHCDLKLKNKTKIADLLTLIDAFEHKKQRGNYVGKVYKESARHLSKASMQTLECINVKTFSYSVSHCLGQISEQTQVTVK